MSIESTLRAIHPEAYIISVEVDEHEHRDNCCCEITGKRIVPWDDETIADGHGTILAPVARILFTAPGYDPDGEVLSETDSEWPVISRECIREALDLWRSEVAARPVTNATVSARGAQLRAIDDVVDSLARVA